MFKRFWLAILLLMSLTTLARAQTGNVYPGAGPLYGSSSATFTALLQGGYQLTTSGGGGGGVTDISQTISGATNVAAASTSITFGVLTFSASATVTITAAAAAKTFLTLEICQNGTGGFTPTLATSGVTLTGCTNAPSIGSGGPFTTTLNQCGNIGLYFMTTSTAICTGYAAGPT